MSRNKREGRYAGWCRGKHWRCGQPAYEADITPPWIVLDHNGDPLEVRIGPDVDPATVEQHIQDLIKFRAKCMGKT